MLVLGVLTPEDAIRAINVDVILLLIGMMTLVSGLEVSGFFDLVSSRIATRAKSQVSFLAALMVATAVLSALVLNAGVEQILSHSDTVARSDGARTRFRLGPARHGRSSPPGGIRPRSSGEGRLPIGPSGGVRVLRRAGLRLRRLAPADRERSNDLRAFDDRDHAGGSPAPARGAGPGDRDGDRIPRRPARYSRRPASCRLDRAARGACLAGSVEPRRMRLRGGYRSRRGRQPRPCRARPVRLHYCDGGGAPHPGVMATPVVGQGPDRRASWIPPGSGARGRDPSGRWCPSDSRGHVVRVRTPRRSTSVVGVTHAEGAGADRPQASSGRLVYRGSAAVAASSLRIRSMSPSFKDQ